jgi:hypothetical protein
MAADPQVLMVDMGMARICACGQRNEVQDSGEGKSMYCPRPDLVL